ncbi:MAG TPA: sigma-70 family RNA polymerase sigma factor [Actinomycetota bacterium]|nr:sigma-70 family RNA polymerase sigma factor [Actinomycetota bacterium]
MSGWKLGPARVGHLYETNIARAVRLAALLEGDDDRAQDVAHDAFVRVISRFAHLRSEDAFWAYLRKTIVTVSIAGRRRRETERRHVQRTPAPAPVELPDASERDRVWRALSTLPTRQRAAVVLRYYEDLPDAGVARSLGCSVGATRSLMARALRALRSEMEERGDGDE